MTSRTTALVAAGVQPRTSHAAALFAARPIRLFPPSAYPSRLWPWCPQRGG